MKALNFRLFLCLLILSFANFIYAATEDKEIERLKLEVQRLQLELEKAKLEQGKSAVSVK